MAACPKCGRSMYRQVERDQFAAFETDVCRNCGTRIYHDQVKHGCDKWSPGGEQVHKKSKSIAQMRLERGMKTEIKKKYTYADCLECGKNKRVVARGLCSACYPRLKKAGELDSKYPAKTSNKKPQGDHEIVCAPVDVTAIESADAGIPDAMLRKVTPITRTPVVHKDKNHNLELEISERDDELLAALRDWADEDRRDLPNQILHILDRVVADRAKGATL